MQALVIDAFSFCQQEEQREGNILIAELPRLMEETAHSQGELVWTLKGGKDQFGHPQLVVTVKGGLQLMCQRCLTPFAFDVDSESVLILARDEESADEIEALIDDEEIDVVVGSKSFNIIDLIEDEALLAIPQSPKHEVCPDEVSHSSEAAVSAKEVADTNKKVSPFAVLKKLN